MLKWQPSKWIFFISGSSRLERRQSDNPPHNYSAKVKCHDRFLVVKINTLSGLKSGVLKFRTFVIFENRNYLKIRTLAISPNRGLPKIPDWDEFLGILFSEKIQLLPIFDSIRSEFVRCQPRSNHLLANVWTFLNRFHASCVWSHRRTYYCESNIFGKQLVPR